MELSADRAGRDLLKLYNASTLRRLTESSKWCSEMLYYLQEEPESSTSGGAVAMEEDEEGEASCPSPRTLRFIQSCMDSKEFKRAANLSKGSTGNLLTFLHYYSRYLDGEQQKLDSTADALDSSRQLKNEELKSLYESLAEISLDGKLQDPYLKFVYGRVLCDLGMPLRAIVQLVEAVNSEPSLWPAWLELSRLIQSKEQLSKLNLPEHWMKRLMLGEVYIRWQMLTDALEIYEEFTAAGFENCPYIMTKIALAQHSLQELDNALETFQKLFAQDPYRLDQMDIYSNTLFVKEMRIELAKLAHHCYDVNKFCPETCGVVGNYYTIRGEHERAVIHFQRALRLDPKNVGAWTLMGHEFMELKNTSAASKAYRKALELDVRDFRGWYSLGQLYDILKMPNYAMYYYNMAHKMKPQDSRMLMALGDVLSQQNRVSDAKKCFWKAHCVGDIEGSAVVKLAKLFEREEEGSDDQAAALYRMFLQQLDQQGLSDEENEALCYRFLADYCLKKDKLDEATEYAQYCAEYDETKEHGKGILKKIAEKRKAKLESPIPEAEDNQAENSSEAATPID